MGAGRWGMADAQLYKNAISGRTTSNNSSYNYYNNNNNTLSELWHTHTQKYNRTINPSRRNQKLYICFSGWRQRKRQKQHEYNLPTNSVYPIKTSAYTSLKRFVEERKTLSLCKFFLCNSNSNSVYVLFATLWYDRIRNMII